MSSGIFISYRRDDTRQAAGRLADDLADEFGRERIFRDIERIEIGVDFAQALEQALAQCQLMLVLIGQRWTDIADASGKRRLDQPGDWIRSEIATALKRNIRVVPVLVDGARLPTESELPEELRPLLRRQAFAIEDGRWRSDVGRLVEALSHLDGLKPAATHATATPLVATAPPPAAVPVAVPAAPAAAAAAPRSKLRIGVAVAAALVVGLGVVLWFGGGSEPAASSGTSVATEPSGSSESSGSSEPSGSADAAVSHYLGTWTDRPNKSRLTITQAADGSVIVAGYEGRVLLGEGPAAEASQTRLAFHLMTRYPNGSEGYWKCTLAFESSDLTGPCEYTTAPGEAGQGYTTTLKRQR